MTLPRRAPPCYGGGVIAPRPDRMTAEEFLRWAPVQPQRFELDGGDVHQMSPERIAHARAKARIMRLLEDAIVQAGLPCEALPDGVAVTVDEQTVYEPDALVRCGPPLHGDDVAVTDPMIVFEVSSPSTQALDLGAKLAGYFRVPSLVHYVIVRLRQPAIIHHRRGPDGGIATRVIHDDTLLLDPPGLALRGLFSSLPAP